MAVGSGCSNMNGCIFDKWCWSAGTGSCTLADVDQVSVCWIVIGSYMPPGSVLQSCFECFMVIRRRAVKQAMCTCERR